MPEKFFVFCAFVQSYHSLYFAIRCLGKRSTARISSTLLPTFSLLYQARNLQQSCSDFSISGSSLNSETARSR